MKIGSSDPYIVAEISGNHGGEMNRALELVHAAAQSGADAVKLQTFKAEDMTLPNPDWVVSGGLWDGIPVFDLYKKLETPRQWHGTLFDAAKRCGIDCFSSPFSVSDVEFLEQFNPPCYKIASNEAWDSELVKAAKKTGKPVIVSMGAGGKPIKGTLPLYCVSEYPAKDFAFGNMLKLGKVYGFSDHSTEIMPAIVATAMGASIIEKHLKVDDSSLDAGFSVMPDDFAAMVKRCRQARDMMGEDETTLPAAMYTRQWFAAKDIKAGEKFSKRNVRTLRAPQGTGKPAYDKIYGMVAEADIAKDAPVC